MDVFLDVAGADACLVAGLGAAGARKVDVELEANVLLIFGKTSVGTP